MYWKWIENEIEVDKKYTGNGLSKFTADIKYDKKVKVDKKKRR